MKYGITGEVNPTDRYTQTYLDGWNAGFQVIATFDSRLPARFLEVTLCKEYLNVGDYQPYNAGTPLPKYETSKIVREPSDDRLTIPSMTLTGDVGFADLTAVASSYTRRFSRIQDGTYINSSYLGTQVTDPALGYTVGNLPSAVLLDNGIDENSFEVRLASKPYDISRSSLTWVGGAFYSRTKTNVYDVEPVYGINSAFSSAGQNIANPAALAGAFPNDFPNDNSYYSARHYDDQQQALFGEVTYYLTPGLRLTAGLRYLEAEQNFHRDGGDYFAGGPTSVNINSSTSANTPRFAIDWDATRSTTAYINIAKGFRLGAANRPIPNTGAVQEDFQNLGVSGYPAVFNPDSLWSYELGTKSRFLDNRITLNADLFYIRWNNIQQDIELPISGFDYEANVGSAISEGGEVELKARVAAPLLVSASFGYTHAVFGEDVPSLGVDGDGDLNVRKGDPIEGVPRFNARLGGEYRFAALADADGILRLSGSYVGPSHGTFIRDQSDYLRPGYFSADASATLQFNRYEVSLFVTNLTNNQTILQQPVIQSVNEAYRLRPRTIGLSLSAYL